MSKVLTDNQYYGQIANIIREQNGTNNTYTPPQMVSALKDLFYEEVEGVPPISFNGIGENLLDYRIDGASGGVGDRTKNLLKIKKNSFTLKGVTFTVNNDKSITCNGTASSIILIELSNYFEDLIVNNEYIFSGCPPTGSISTYRLQLVLYSGAVYNIYGEEKKFTYKEEYVGNPNKSIRIVIEKDYVCNNLTFYPMIRLASIEDDTYEPYGYKVPVVVSGKNLLSKLPYSRIDKGIEYTNVNNLYLHIEGTSNAAYSQTTPISLLFKKGKYYINFYCDEQYKSKLFILLRNNNNIDIVNVYSSGASFELNNDETIKLIAGVKENNTTINTNMYIQIVSGITSQSTYEPYHEPITTNIYLDKPIDGKANIPSEYTEVEYLESTGTQYIDTSFKSTIYTSIETVFSTKAPTSDANLFGSRVSGGIQDYTIWINTSSNKGIACHFPFKSGSSRDTKWVYTGNIIDIPTKLLITPENIKVNDELVYTFTDTRTEYTPNLNAYIFARNDNGNSASLGRFKVYYFKIWDEGQLVRDLVPCYRKSDNVAGLYDLVNNTFYTNQGTGNFIVGPIKETESISLSDTNTNIPTIRGTNVLTVDTTVQPSNVYVKARKESQYETAMRERYEQELSDIKSALEEV